MCTHNIMQLLTCFVQVTPWSNVKMKCSITSYENTAQKWANTHLCPSHANQWSIAIWYLWWHCGTARVFSCTVLTNLQKVYNLSWESKQTNKQTNPGKHNSTSVTCNLHDLQNRPAIHIRQVTFVITLTVNKLSWKKEKRIKSAGLYRCYVFTWSPEQTCTQVNSCYML